MKDKRPKKQQTLNDLKTDELLKLLESKKELMEFKKELGVNSVTIWNWRNKKAFPFYCNMYLKLKDLKKRIEA